jgi:ribonuclease D
LSANVSHRSITTDPELKEYAAGLAGCEWIAIDTEFVAEDTYRPVLCLIQVATAGELAVIDPLGLTDLTPFWNALADERHETIVHAGRGDVEFSLTAIGRPPARLFDVQVAAGLIGIEYPAGYGTLISKLLGKKTKKHETRTDWRRRPLSKRQIQYALDDVYYLPLLREKIGTELTRLGRQEWLADEMRLWQAEIERAATQDRWRRVSGNSGLEPRELAVVRELWHWREKEAERRDQPVRRVLRDDLIVELARRQTADPQRIEAVRGLERGDLRRRLGEIAARIRRALELADEECPTAVRFERTPKLSVLGQFLFAALGSICREAELAPQLVGTPNDIRELIAYRTGLTDSRRDPPKLAVGWRAELVGHLFDDLLAGRKSIRIADATSEHPLVFE